MISKLDYRFWIIFCYYILIRCLLCNLFPYGTLALSHDDAAPNVAKLNDTKNILFIHANELRDDVGENEYQHDAVVGVPLTHGSSRNNANKNVGREEVEKRYTVLQHQQTKTDTTQKTNIYDNSDNNNYGKSSRIINENDMNSVSYTTDIYSNKFNYNGSDSHSNNSIPATIKTKDKRRKSSVLRKATSNKKVKERKQHFFKYLWSNKSNYNNKDYKKRNHRNTNINNNRSNNIAKVSKLEKSSDVKFIDIRGEYPKPDSIKQTINQNNRHKRSSQIESNDETIDATHKTNNTPLDKNTQTTKILTNTDTSSNKTSTTSKLSYEDITDESNVSKSKQKDKFESTVAAVADDISVVLDDDETFEETVTSITPATPQRKSIRHVNGDKGDYVEEPRALPLRPIISGPFEDDPQNEVHIVYAEQRAPVKLACEVDLDLVSSVWMKDGIIVHVVDKSSRSADFRFYREPRGSLTITNVMLEDDGIWQCEAENFRGYVENARPIKLVVLDPPKPPYLLIDRRRLDAGNIFVPVKENSEFSLACISEGGNPKPILSWEVLLSPSIDRHAQKLPSDLLELQEVKSELDKDPFKITTGAISEARLPVVYRAHHNARILCVMEHPTLKVRQNASILLDVQYTPSFAITRSPGFGFPLREGIEVSLKCDVDSNPPSTPMWQKDDGDPPVMQNGDGFLNFTSIRKEHAGWYKCTSRHLNYQYSSIGYFLSIRSDTVDVTSEPLEQESSMPSIHNPYKTNQMEVEFGGSVTLQCPQGSLGCWSHLDPSTVRLKGLGTGTYAPTGQFSLKDVVYSDAGSYKCIGQSVNNKKKLEVLKTVSVSVKGPPTVSAKNVTPVAHPGSPLHLTVEFCANPPAYAARWLHGERIYHPGNQYGADVLAYGFIDLPTPYCKEARLTYVHMHEKVPRQFYFIVSSPTGVSEIIFNVNFTLKGKKSNKLQNSVDEDEELMLPEEIHFPIFGSSSVTSLFMYYQRYYYYTILLLLSCFYMVNSI